ncbi:DUF4430 domain-containing protein [[Clostridium] polysaccharolyticum]|uniref:Transcobalamin-like C-terminal domain-containing protein n=1 Tax=[Clostridium] polysaccharolyticum TaxID=29364 RepID=A0A1H9YP65_9FIRM|nr:DUF4430 domain-containing protein [[Clostridium] polysaccharolyticum]SES70923.1 protein of unknown function [[Clostridium] polysaccharolyticum]
MDKRKSLKWELAVSAALLAAAILAAILVGGNFKQKGNVSGQSSFQVQVQIVNDAESYNKNYKFKTKEKTLGDLLVKEDLITYKDSEYGKFITAADGMEADESKEQWWNVEVNGEASQTGIDGIQIKDGDKYTLTMMTGY